MSEFDDVIGAARAGFEPSRADRDRVWKGLSARAGLAGAAVVLATKTAAGTAAGTTGALAGQSVAGLVKLFFTSVAVTLAAGSAVVGVTRYRPAEQERARTTAALPSAGDARSAADGPRVDTSDRALVPPAVASVESAAPPAAGRSALSAPLETTPEAERDEVARELSLLRAARQAANDGQHARAQELLDRLDQQFPRGTLLEERAALRAITACEAGAARGAEQAAAFLRRYPTSVYAGKVQRVCPSSSKSSVRSFTDPEGGGH